MVGSVASLDHPQSRYAAPRPGHPCRVLADAYAEGVRSAGREVRLIDIATRDFPVPRTADEFIERPLPVTLKDAVQAAQDAEQLAFIFPLWPGTMPALLKAFLEQVKRTGIAFTYPEAGKSGFAKTLLRGGSARLVVTMGMPASFYRFWYLGHGVAGMPRNILNFVGISPVRETLLGWWRRKRRLGREIDFRHACARETGG